MRKYKVNEKDVLVIGCGGAGLRAAIEVKSKGLSVNIIGKRSKFDSHTVLAAGGINASFGNKDYKDSWEHHFADTYIEGYGIGDPEAIEILAKESPELVQEIDSWGANLQKLKNGKFDQRFFGAHSYRRTCYSGDYTGQSILNALLSKAEQNNIIINDSEYVTELLIKDSKCFGAISFNKKNSFKTIHFAKAIILCTGGHTRIWKQSSSREKENNGDGLWLAAKAGCELIDMEMVQFHPTGMLMPKDIAGTLVTEAVRGEGGLLLNKNRERFMVNYDKRRMELSTRDRVALANYTEIINGRGTKNGGVFLDISHKSKEFIKKKIPKIYEQFLIHQNLDISKSPMEVAPTAHYSMGGIKVSAGNHETKIKGLFAAGEVAGGLHGANRLGGNSLAEILVFGRRVGKAAADYSKSSKDNIDYENKIFLAKTYLEKINLNYKNNSVELLEILKQVMWDYCGVVKEESTLKQGLNMINDLENKSNNTKSDLNSNNINNLISTLDLKASIFSAKVTIESCLNRKESRGSNQRSDFKEINTKFNQNVLVNFKNDQIHINMVDLKQKKEYINQIIKNSKLIKNFRGKLLE